MSEKSEFVYVTSTQDGKSYGLRHRDGVEKCVEDLDMMRRQGDELVRLFKVPSEMVGQTIEACEEFIEGKISLEDLEIKVDPLQKYTKF